MEKGTVYQERRRMGSSLFFAFILAFIMLLATCNDTRAQQIDSSITPEQAIAFMAKSFRISQKEYRAGWITSAAGTSLLIIGSSIDQFKYSSSGRDIQENPARNGLIFGGCIISLAGLYMIIDSHSSIGNAGRIHLTPNGLVLKLDK